MPDITITAEKQIKLLTQGKYCDSDIIIVPEGGGGVELFGAIGVEYPIGSLLTCTNGVITLTAETDSGQWVFAIPEAGTWTVTSTDKIDSTKTKSKSVVITAEGQWVTVKLSYNLDVFLNGEYRNIGNMSNMTLESGELVLTATGTQLMVSFSDVPVDITDYSTLNWDVKWVNNNSTYWEYRDFWIGLSATNTPVTSEPSASDDIYASQFVTYFKTSETKTYEGDVALDIRNLTGEYYLCAMTNSWGSGNTILYSREIVVE